jgi:large conductance mechanosensitive channel
VAKQKVKKERRKSTFIADFKKFIMRGNVMDMAVGVIVGGAFTSIVTSLNKDILTPLLGLIGGTDFSYLFVQLGGTEEEPILLAYGNFITAVINFLITALVIFCLIKFISFITDKLSKKEEPAPAAPTTKECPYCKSAIAIAATRCPHCTSQLED